MVREEIVEAALELVQRDGVESLTMRRLADQLGVKAASLYWHVRDRRELLDLLADAILGAIRPVEGNSWRESALQLAAEVETVASTRRDAALIVLGAPGALERSAVHARIQAALASAGLDPAAAHASATMLLTHVLLNPAPKVERAAVAPGKPASIAVDSGSRGVTLRAGAAMDTLVRVPHDQRASGPAVVRGETVIVRRLRGVGEAEIELNPANPWLIKVQGPTWNTRLDLAGLDIRGIHLDSGAARVQVVLPAPRGEVPITVSGGIVGVKLFRPPGVRVVAMVKSGAVKVRLDAFAIRATVADAQWESAPATSSSDRYALLIHGGAVQVTLDEQGEQDQQAPAADRATAQASTPVPRADPREAVNVLLDGVEARISHGSAG